MAAEIIPHTYWETFNGLYQMGPQKHRLYLLDLLQNKDVKSLLDVGCGTGPIYELLQQNRNRWSGIEFYKGTDYSRSMIKVCQKEFPFGNWEVEDARALKEPNNRWECVLLMHCLDHLDNYQAAIKEAARVAKKYVMIVLWRSFVPGEKNNLNDRNMYGKQPGEEPWQDTYLHEYSREKLEDEFKKNNLEIEIATNGEEINEPGKSNFLYLLKKT